MPGIIRCPSCGQEISADKRFCEHCGARLCPGCHGSIPPRVKFCPHCGFAVGPAVSGDMEQAPPTPPVPPPGPMPRPTPGPMADEGATARWQTPGGYITGRQDTQPQQPAPTPSVSPYPADQSTPATPIPTPYSETQPPLTTGPRMPSGPIPARRFPMVIVILMVIVGLFILGFVAWNQGWLESPLGNVQELISGIGWPNWVPFATTDTTPPAITNVEVSDITASSAVIKWETDKPATSQVMVCDPDGGCTWTEPSETLATAHSISLSDLKSNVMYKFTATSTDAKENQAIHEGEFTTLSGTATAPLLITGINVSKITDLGATINWKTDKPASSQVEYGITDTYGKTTPLDDEPINNHSTTLTGLQPNTNYHFRVKSIDAEGNEAISDDQTFTTRGTVSVASEVGTEVGKRAPDFTLEDMDGKDVSLSDFRGSIVMVTFWVEVRYARTHMPVIQTFYGTEAGKELVILAINWKQGKEQVQAFVTDKGLTFDILLDQDGEVSDKYKLNPSSNPTTFFIDAQGFIKHRRDVSFSTPIQIEEIVKSL